MVVRRDVIKWVTQTLYDLLKSLIVSRKVIIHQLQQENYLEIIAKAHFGGRLPLR